MDNRVNDLNEDFDELIDSMEWLEVYLQRPVVNMFFKRFQILIMALFTAFLFLACAQEWDVSVKWL